MYLPVEFESDLRLVGVEVVGGDTGDGLHVHVVKPQHVLVELDRILHLIHTLQTWSHNDNGEVSVIFKVVKKSI